MSFVSNRFTSLLCVVGTAGLLAACPDSGEAPDARVETMFDAAGPDASIDAGPDAGPDAAPDKPVSGTVAVLDVKITNNLGASFPNGLAGNAVSVSFFDPDFDEGVVTFGTPGTIGECAVTVYDAALGQTGPPAIDDGPVVIAGATTPTIGGCAFVAAAGSYLCPAGQGLIPAGTTIAAAGDGTVTITFPVGTTLPTDNVGRGLILAGLEDANNNTPAGSTFPIMANPAANIIVIANPTGGTSDTTTAAAATFLILSGAGPTPAARDFLGLATEVTLTKGAGMTPAVSQVFTAAGDGLLLATDSIKPELMPKTAPVADLKVSCLASEGGTCGGAGVGGIAGLVVTGRTTNSPVPAFPIIMPAPTATGKIATFTCTFTSQSGVIPAAAWAAVLATNPTRIETRIIRARAVPGAVNVLAGHALVGYTTIP